MVTIYDIAKKQTCLGDGLEGVKSPGERAHWTAQKYWG